MILFSTLNWIVFAAVFFVLYASNVVADRIVRKKWILKRSLWFFYFGFVLCYISILPSDYLANTIVKARVPCQWKEVAVLTQDVEDVVRTREKEGSFFLGFGSTNERETFRYSVIKEDGSKLRDKVYTSDCVIMKAEKKKRIVYVRNVRIYKDPADREFYCNTFDRSDGFYRAYIL